MRNRKSTETIALLSASAALVTIFLSCHELAPRIDRRLHAEIGKALAKEAISLLGHGGQITVIARDTETFRQPAIDILLESFKREAGRANALIGAIQWVQVDPLRPVEVPPGDFFELIRRSPAGHVIVSLLGPPLLTEEQRTKLGRVKPKIVAFCSGNLPEKIDLNWLFNAGLLHSAVVSRRGPPVAEDKRPTTPKAFDQLYRTIKAGDFSTSPSAAAL